MYLSCAAADCVDSRPTAPSAWARLNVAAMMLRQLMSVLSRHQGERQRQKLRRRLISSFVYTIMLWGFLTIYFYLYTDATAAAHDLQ